VSDAGTEKKIKLFTGLDKISGRCPLAGREWGGEGVIRHWVLAIVNLSPMLDLQGKRQTEKIQSQGDHQGKEKGSEE
jgi:hypothetical protein